MSGPLRIVYVGSHLPLHGVEIIVDAATLLEDRHGPRFAHFTLIGGGMTAPRAARDTAARGLRSVRLLPAVTYTEALDAIAGADIALGIFGSTGKSARVVPHKVYQAMALGVPVITRRSRAIAEFFRDGEHLILIPPADPPALANAIEALGRDPDLRVRLAGAGRAAVLDQASPERVGSLLVEAITRARDSTAPRVKR